MSSIFAKLRQALWPSRAYLFCTVIVLLSVVVTAWLETAYQPLFWLGVNIWLLTRFAVFFACVLYLLRHEKSRTKTPDGADPRNVAKC